MKNLLDKYNEAFHFCFIFLYSKFRASKLTTADFEDCICTAFEKLVLDARKTQPKLTPSFQTLRYLSYLATIDLYRKRKGEASMDTYPLSIYDISHTEEGTSISKQAVREAIDLLPQKQRALVEERFRIVGQDAFVEMTVEAINLRDCEKKQAYDEVAPKMGITAGNARVIFNRDIKPCLEETLRRKMAA